jgi:hypothetical protein
MPAKHRNKDAWATLHRDQDVGGAPLPPSRLGTGDEDLDKPLPS